MLIPQLEDKSIINYASPGAQQPLDSRGQRTRTTITVLAIAWMFAAMTSGVGSDHVNLSVEKKIALTTSAAVICWLLLIRPGDRNLGCAMKFGVIALWIVGVAWFWN